MKLTLQQAAERANVGYEAMKKHAQRGQLRTSKDGAGGRLVIDSDDLDAYVATGAMADAVEASQGKDGPGVAREIASAITNMSPSIQQAILDGIPSPSAKRLGSSEPFRKAREREPVNRRANIDEAAAEAARKLGPHCGYPIGHVHTFAPQWYRSSESTWRLGGASWSWNGYEWEGGGVRAGASLGDGISPADPDADRRPSAPPTKVGKDGKDERA